MLISLLEWITITEDKLAHQDIVNEEIDDLHSQIDSFKVRTY